MIRRAVRIAVLLGAAAGLAQAAPPDDPVLLRLEPPERGGPTALPEASPSGKIDLRGPCVALESRPGHSTIIVSTAQASVGRDSHGPYLEYRGRRFRHGTWVKGGGGAYDRVPAFGPLQEPVPAACSAGPFLIFYGIEGFAPSSLPPVSPPPPPVGGERG